MDALAKAAPISGVRLVPRVLPVTWAGMPPALTAAIAETKPDALLMFGLDRHAVAVKVETRAVNRANPKTPDADGQRHPTGKIAADGPAARRIGGDCEGLVRAIAGCGVGAKLSHDAGDYLCNTAIWTALDAAPDLPLAFIHVPPDGRLPQEKLLQVALASVKALSERLAG